MGKKIREFLRDLFGSRYTEHLEQEILRVHGDCELRLRDKDDVIATLREEKSQLQAKIISLENAIMPLVSRAGLEVVRGRTGDTSSRKPNFSVMSSMPPIETSWQKTVREHDERMAKELDEEKAAEAAKR